MGEGNIFTLCVSPHLDGEGGGYLHPADRGYPLPRSGQGDTPSQIRMGVSLSHLRQFVLLIVFKLSLIDLQQTLEILEALYFCFL